METKELIEFLKKYKKDYNVIDELITRLKELDDLKLRLQDIKFPVLGEIK